MKIVYLYPLSTFNTLLRSDTLWGLIMVAIKNIKGEKYFSELIDAYLNNEPPFIVSSAMFFKNYDNNKIPFFPKPLFAFNQIELNDAEEMRLYKKFKKIKWLSKKYFEKLINGELEMLDIFNKVKNSEDLNNFCGDEIQIFNILHNSIDRMKNSTLKLNNEGQLYYKNDFYIENGGLFFLIEGDVSIIEPALRLLRHFGYGGDTSIGKGFFDFEIGDLELNIPQTPNLLINLSLYVPSNNDLYNFNINNLWYELEFRSGKIGSKFLNTKEYRKNVVVMFKEGSVFPYNNISKGCLVNSQIIDDKKIFSCGYSINIPAYRKEVV